MPLHICGYIDSQTPIVSVISKQRASSYVANKWYLRARKFLRSSPTAMQIINHFTHANEKLNLVIDLDDRIGNLFHFPEKCHSSEVGCRLRYCVNNQSSAILRNEICDGAGCVTWSPMRNIRVVAIASSLRLWAQMTPRNPWTPFRENPQICEHFRTTYEVVPLLPQSSTYAISNLRLNIPAPVLLIHEMGHAMQYALDMADFKQLDKIEGGKYESIFQRPSSVPPTPPPLEVLNVATIENKVCIELRAAGNKVGVRWQYGDDSGRGFKAPHHNWTIPL